MTVMDVKVACATAERRITELANAARGFDIEAVNRNMVEALSALHVVTAAVRAQCVVDVVERATQRRTAAEILAQMPPECGAVTKSMTWCQRKADGFRYCWQHSTGSPGS